MRLALNTQPAIIDPRRCADYSSSTLSSLLFEGLTRCVKGKTIELALAEKIELSEDEKTYIFHLKKAFWSDRAPILAEDFEASWKTIIEKKYPCAFLFYPIKNVEKCIENKLSIEEVGIYCLDEKTLCIELERPTPYFTSLCAFPSFAAYPMHAKNPVYSGPFQIEKFAHNFEILLAKNPLYWNRERVQIEKISISIIPDEMTAYELFAKKQLDWIGGPLSPLPFDGIEKLKNQCRFIPNAASTFCSFNTETFPFKNQTLRKAFSYVIDRERIVQEGSNLGKIPARSALPPTFTDLSENLFDERKGKKLFEKALRELGIDKKDFPPITLTYKQSQTEKRIAQILQSEWEKAFSLKIFLVQLDPKSHYHTLQTRDYTISLTSWIAQFDDPISILDRFKSKKNLKNYPGWEDSEYQKALLLGEDHPLIRKEAFSKAEKTLLQSGAIAPLFHWSFPVLLGENIESIETSSTGGILFDRFVLRKAPNR